MADRFRTLDWKRPRTMTEIQTRDMRFIDRFLFQGCSPQIVPWLRIGFAVLVIINTLVWLRDATILFTDSGVLKTATAIDLNKHERYSILFSLPSTPAVVNACLVILLVQSSLLLLGVWSRFQMACIFVWIVSFQYRNPLICDGEDTLFRCFAFFMIFLPLDCGWSLTRRWYQWRGFELAKATMADAWALRFIQIQMTIIYCSATWYKLLGSTWQDGTALYYVSHMTDHFGRFPALTGLFDQLWFVKAMTWSVIAIEGLLPILLWWPRTRVFGILLGIALHLGIELTMHLFLFQWIMILGLCSFYPSSRLSLRPPFSVQ